MNSQKVREKAESRVVSITVLMVRSPLCPMPFAMTKQLIVVDEPHITSRRHQQVIPEPQMNS